MSNTKYTSAHYHAICQSLVGGEHLDGSNKMVKVLKFWKDRRGKDMFWIQLQNGKRIDVEAWYITDHLPEAAIKKATE